MSTKILIAGCGLSGAAVNWFLRRCLLHTPPSVRIETKIIDAAPYLAGRMTSYRFPSSDLSIQSDFADLGAQYITRFHGAEHDDMFQFLLQSGTLQIFDPTSNLIVGIKPSYALLPHYVVSKGFQDVMQQIISTDTDSGTNVQLSTQLISLTQNYKNKVTASLSSLADGSITHEEFDHVILTLPIPALLAVQGDFLSSAFSSIVLDKLRDVRYSSRFALALQYRLTPSQATAIEAQFTWRAKYVDDPALRYLSIENFKSDGIKVGNMLNIIAHSGGPFYSSAIAEDRLEKDIIADIITAITKELPFLHDMTPAHIYLHPWSVSQVMKAYPLEEGQPPFLPAEKGELIIAGDMMTTSNFEGCLTSARAAAEYLAGQILQAEK